MVAPASAMAVQMMFAATLTARWSVPVTSRRMFFVSVVTRVRSPLMIGGNEQTWSSSSVIRGKSGKSLTIFA